MDNQQTKTNLDFSTVKDDLPLPLIWHQVLRQIISSTSVVSVVAIVFIVFMMFFVGLIFWAALNSNPSDKILIFLFVLTFSLIFILGLIFRTAKKTREMLRASAFAQTNGFSFTEGQKDPAYPGLIFSIGDTRVSSSAIEGSYNNRGFKIFNYSYMEGSGKNRSEHDKGVIMIKLPRKLPNVVFDSKANNFMGISTLGATFQHSEKFSLEGDFNKHFDVYAPQNYGLDVLYFMTPELMALLVDEANNYDIEVVYDNLFFYAPEFDFKTQQLASIFKIIQNIGGEFSQNTRLYADERVGDKAINTVAVPGQRLKKGIPWITVIVIIIYFIFWTAGQIAGSH